MADDTMKLFSPPVADWFTGRFGQPTQTQKLGWPAIAGGGNALICAPTGTGKTLCAFLLAIDSLLRKQQQEPLGDGVRVLYISPLKALGNDIFLNLEVPLEGIAALTGQEPGIRKAIRTGDTPAADRRRMAAHPPHILITTPESLYLLLASKDAGRIFGKIETVIVDELHALLETKRGAHLALSLERLARIAPYQRIGLTATVEPLREAADFLGGTGRPVQIVDARTPKAMEVRVECPAQSFFGLPEASIWPEIARTIAQNIRKESQVLVFCNNRATAENVAAAVNRELGEEAAATHHGSMDKERRLEAEKRFKEGTLRCLCATASMELGIDIGSVSMVVQVASPLTCARGLQRLGRSGHRPGETSRMQVLPRMAQDALQSAFVTRAMLQGLVEPMAAPRLCLDVLAQHIVSIAAREECTVDELLTLSRGAFPYRDLPREELLSVLRMLRGDFDHQAGRDFRPRILFDEQEGIVRADHYSRLLATMGGTIPDRGYYAVVTPEGKRLGELDEEFVYEARLGDRFRLGAFTWAIVRIQHDRVVVAPSGGSARSPFWRGEVQGRPSRTGELYGRELGRLEGAPDILAEVLARYPVDLPCARAIASLLEEQKRRLGCLPTDRRLVVEHFRDEGGEAFIAVHCPLGSRVNQPLAMALRDTAERLVGRSVQAYHSEDGVLLHLPGEETTPTGLLQLTDPAGIRSIVLRDLPGTQVFSVRFREAAAVALMLGGRRQGGRNPLWVQRLRGAEALSRAAETGNHPLIVETYRACMERAMEIERAVRLLADVRSNAVQVTEVRSDTPSPMTRALRDQLIGMYTYVEAIPQDVAARGALAQGEIVAPAREHAARHDLPLPRTPEELYARLARQGTLDASEYAHIPEAAHLLLEQKKARQVAGLLTPSHEADALRAGLAGAMDLLRPFLLRHIRTVGEAEEQSLCERFGSAAAAGLEACVAQAELSSYERDGEAFYATPERVQRALSAAAQERREQVQTVPGSHYAALLPGWQRALGDTPPSRLSEALSPLYGLYLEPSLWENVVLPSRVRGYRPRDLDHALMTGELIWRMQDGKAAFFPPDTACLPPPEGDAADALYQALRAGGAQFPRQLSRQTGLAGEALLKALNALAAQGLAVCDGFAPLRAAAAADDAKRRARARAKELSDGGRWEAAAPPEPLTAQAQLALLFDRWAVVSRECASLEGLAWPPLLDELRRMEYRDEVRRGYFVRELAGAQFVRTSQFARVCSLLAAPQGIAVLSAADPAQAYGSLLPGVGVMSLPGSAVVLEGGVPVLAAEQHGDKLRLPGNAAPSPQALDAFAQAFLQKRLWPGRLRLTLRQWPEQIKENLLAAGFRPDMLHLTLWREGR